MPLPKGPAAGELDEGVPLVVLEVVEVVPDVVDVWLPVRGAQGLGSGAVFSVPACALSLPE